MDYMGNVYSRVTGTKQSPPAITVPKCQFTGYESDDTNETDDDDPNTADSEASTPQAVVQVAADATTGTAADATTGTAADATTGTAAAAAEPEYVPYPQNVFVPQDIVDAAVAEAVAKNAEINAKIAKSGKPAVNWWDEPLPPPPKPAWTPPSNWPYNWRNPAFNRPAWSKFDDNTDIYGSSDDEYSAFNVMAMHGRHRRFTRSNPLTSAACAPTGAPTGAPADTPATTPAATPAGGTNVLNVEIWRKLSQLEAENRYLREQVNTIDRNVGKRLIGLEERALNIERFVCTNVDRLTAEAKKLDKYMRDMDSDYWTIVRKLNKRLTALDGVIDPQYEDKPQVAAPTPVPAPAPAPAPTPTPTPGPAPTTVEDMEFIDIDQPLAAALPAAPANDPWDDLFLNTNTSA